MAYRLLVSINLKNPESDLDLKTISYVSALHIDVGQENFDVALKFVQEKFGSLSIYCDCTSLQTTDQIISLLNAGCTKIFLTESTLNTLGRDGYTKEHIGRFILSLDHLENGSEKEDVGANEQLYAQGAQYGLALSCRSARSPMTMKGRLKEWGIEDQFYVRLSAPSLEDATKCVRDGYNVIVPSSCMTVNPVGDDKKIALSSLFTDVLRSDREDGLLPTIVTDERQISLGLVYSSRESVKKALQMGRGVYYSRSRNGLWIKGEESGDTQELLRISVDCDTDALLFKVRQRGKGFCHLQRTSCFGPSQGVSKLENTLEDRKRSAPEGSYTARLFNDSKLLEAKIMEEASELCEAKDKTDIADEAADLLYFVMTKCTAAGVSFQDVEKSLDGKSMKVMRRRGDAKPQWAEKVGLANVEKGPEEKTIGTRNGNPNQGNLNEAVSVAKAQQDPAGLVDGKIQMKRYITSEIPAETIREVLQRPSQRATDGIINIVKPIIEDIRAGGDSAVLKYTHKFEQATSLTTPVLKAPFPEHLMQLPPETIEAIDTSYENIRKFHAAQAESGPLKVETMPGVVCSRFSRPIERVGLYVPGGTAVLPSTAMMLGVPAMVAGCKKIVIASPPRSDGTITPEIVYVANKVGAESIVLAGGAQAIAALAYGTESISKVDKILGPGNQFVTAGKMIVSNDTTAGVSIDMPAGPSEVLVIADKSANPAFVASDLLSQAEHGEDSQVVLIAVDLGEKELAAIENELHAQANALPRVNIVKKAIGHSVTLVVRDINEAMRYSNDYAPEHLILQVKNAEDVVAMVHNAGSVFVGPWTPESVGDYSSGTNHSLPTYGYAKQYSGVNLSSFTKHITCSNLTREGLKNVGGAVMQLAKVEELEAHRRAVSIRLDGM